MCFLLLTLILGACGGGGVEGETVTMTGALIGEDQEGFRANLAAISEATGIEITYQGSDNFEQELQIQIESGDTPDFALWPQPGGVVDAADYPLVTQAIGNTYDALGGSITGSFPSYSGTVKLPDLNEKSRMGGALSELRTGLETVERSR